MSMDVLGAAQSVLDSLVVAIPQVDPTITLPTRRYVTGGDVAFDCDQFVVTTTSVIFGFPRQEQPRAVGNLAIFSAVITVLWLHCVDLAPNGIPATGALEAAGERTLKEGGVLLQAAMKGLKDKTLASGCTPVSVGPMTFVGPEGGQVGVSLELGVQL